MRLVVCCVYDAAVGAYLQPFFSRSVPEALRSFYDAVTQEDSRFKQHAKDYTLFKCGEWDDQTGLFGESGSVFPLATALEVLNMNGKGG